MSSPTTTCPVDPPLTVHIATTTSTREPFIHSSILPLWFHNAPTHPHLTLLTPSFTSPSHHTTPHTSHHSLTATLHHTTPHSSPHSLTSASHHTHTSHSSPPHSHRPHTTPHLTPHPTLLQQPYTTPHHTSLLTPLPHITPTPLTPSHTPSQQPHTTPHSSPQSLTTPSHHTHTSHS